METYGVNFEGFEPSCGWPLYRFIENTHLPALRAEIERWRKKRDALADESALLRQVKADLEEMTRCHGKVIAELGTTINEDIVPLKTATLNEIMPLGVQEAKQDGEIVETGHTWQELSLWLDKAKAFIGDMSIYIKYARERADCGLGLFANCLESSEADISFWEKMLEVQKAHWIFEKAESKYKTKICREIVKMLASFIGDCREQLGRYDEEKRETDSLYKDIKWLFGEAQEDVAYYRQIKADIAAIGVEEALKRSSRTIR